MGTNYYWMEGKNLLAPELTKEKTILEKISEDDVRVHIGKLSASGPYCHDCGTTLCLEGTNSVHFGKSEWSKICPICKKIVRTASSSFTWTMLKHKEILNLLEYCADKIIIDEYGEEYTPEEFLHMIEIYCPIEFQLPVEFS